MNKQQADKKRNELLAEHLTEQEKASCYVMGITAADFLANKVKLEKQHKETMR